MENADCRQFRKRNAILCCLRASQEHPSAEAIYANLKPEYPELSLGTIYRNLARFKQQGLIASLGAVGGTERFDGNTAPHAHFVCTRCARICDLPMPALPEQALRDAHSRGQVDGCSLSFTGVCSACLETIREGGESM